MSELDRGVLPIPDVTPVGLTTYDAKDPATSYPPIRPMRPPEGRAQRALIVLIDDVGFGAVERLRRPDPHAGRRAAGGERAQVQPLPHHRALLADAGGPADRAQPPHGRHGRDHGDRHRRARLQLDPAQHLRPARRDAQAQRLLHRAVRQVPRGAGLGDEPDGPVRRTGRRRRRLRVLLRLHRRRDATSTTRPSTRAPSPVEPERRPKRATTSWRT